MLAEHSRFHFRAKSQCYTWIVPFSESSVYVFSWRLFKRRRRKMRNYTEITGFILLGLSDDPQLPVVSFIFLLITYILSITGNLTIIALTLLDAHLQTPMYFVLRNFSLLEVSFTTLSIPKFLATMITGGKTIPFSDCRAPFILFYFIFILLGVTEFYVLAAMSYDRYIAICKPLHYLTIMNHRVCTLLVLGSWLASFFFFFFSNFILFLNFT